ncbi:TonB-dependent receptor [Microvirga sp. STS02]|uniref:TonB-dependent receptor domain-containing protein n=1 Tax=Hymenobacter negativus TaxID=2795026 RepID=UPI0018DBE4A9|nr:MULTISPECIES: TonB-dependent receptor [Bacteria]MBH8571260.1 TonB-dependent receptor [Hymenobacter negativus]MBR7210997.1 TonB-dependent receptor [Microvirga sp. STS02]
MKTFFTPLTGFYFGRLLLASATMLFLPIGAAMAQTAGPGRVSGSLVEAGSGQAVPFSDVLLLRAADSTFVAVAQTTEQGTFKAAALPLGTYLLRVQDLNYGVLRRRFTLTAAAPSLELSGLQLSAAKATKLSEVVVTGQKAAVVEELGKRVINVDKDLGSVGGTAANVLQNVPSVSVDVNGTVSMRGTSNVTILIDGKPAGVSNGGTGGPRLDQIPASRIAQIEVITNPSAKYDAAGGGGVINLITKKETRTGTNGTAAFNLGTADKYSGNLNLSRKVGKATWTAGYNGRDVTYLNHGHSEQTALLGPGETVRTTQVGVGNEIHRNHSLEMGVELELPKNQSLSLNVSPKTERNIEGESQDLTQQTNGGPVQKTVGRQDLDVKVKILEADGNYRRTWEAHKGRELTANFGTVIIDANVPVVQRQYAEAGSVGVPQPGTRQQLDLLANIQFGQVDYVHPLADGKGRLEMGAKVERQSNHGSNSFGYATSETRPNDFQDDPARSLTYTSNQVVPAAYVTAQHSLGKKWNAQAGLRSEYTYLSGSIQGGEGIAQRGSLRQDYLSFFPSALISRDFGKEAGQNRLQLSYARRLNRPNFMQQLPLAIYQDPRSYRLGNPRLQAEFSHNIELGHQLTIGQATITSTAFARITTNSIQRLRFVDTLATRLAGNAGLVTAETYANLGTTTNLGAEFSLNQPLAKWWRMNASSSLYRAQIAGNGIGNNRTGFIATARLTNNFTIRPTLDLQLSGNVRSAQLTAQGRQLASGQVDIALRQRLFSDRAALTLRIADLLNTQQYRNEIATDVLSSTRYSKDESRVGWLGFTWYIGASKAKPGRIEAAPQGGGGFGG